MRCSSGHIFRSWQKRWVILDFNSGSLHFFKRHYWRRICRALDLHTVAKIIRVSQADICLECLDGPSVLLRSRLGQDDADVWARAFCFAQLRLNASKPQQLSTPAAEPVLSPVVLETPFHCDDASVNTQDMLAFIASAKAGATVPRLCSEPSSSPSPE